MLDQLCHFLLAPRRSTEPLDNFVTMPRMLSFGFVACAKQAEEAIREMRIATRMADSYLAYGSMESRARSSPASQAACLFLLGMIFVPPKVGAFCLRLTFQMDRFGDIPLVSCFLCLRHWGKGCRQHVRNGTPKNFILACVVRLSRASVNVDLFSRGVHNMLFAPDESIMIKQVMSVCTENGKETRSF